MRYAIIAAGEGSRLSQEGVAISKPLVKVGGETLIDRLLRIFMMNGATSIAVVCRPDEKVEKHLRRRQQEGLPLQYIVRTTPSSMHSMYELIPLLDGDEPFVLTTVDTVFRESDFKAYIVAMEQILADGEADGLMGVTDYIDDEKPLYVKTDVQRQIVAFQDADDHPHYVSGGIYGLAPRSLVTLRACIERGEHRMRNFQRALLNDGLRLKAWPFGKVLDIDHATDIEKAEAFLRD
jgi:NDP-sugar pyrophosphorylase family protein